MKRLRDGMRDFFSGRYGVDQLGRFLLIVATISVILSAYLGSSYLYMINVVLLTFALVRVMSRNYSARLEENDKYLDLRNRLFGIFHKESAKKVNDPSYRYYRCPRCSQKIRVPKGKGNISVRCPKCKAEFIRRS